MEIHLRHPVHGIKIATLEAEALADVDHGWEIYNPYEPEPEPEPDPEPEPTPTPPPARRRGRPPKAR